MMKFLGFVNLKEVFQVLELQSCISYHFFLYVKGNSVPFTCIREISIDIDCQPDQTGMASLVTILLPCLEFPGLLNRTIDPGKSCKEVLLSPHNHRIRIKSPKIGDIG